jgi:hypothetical protein
MIRCFEIESDAEQTKTIKNLYSPHEMSKRGEIVAEELRPYSVIGNALDTDFSLNHRSCHGSEFDVDFLIVG